MDFAADAVLDVAPQVRTPNAARASRSDDQLSFDDHLDAVTESDAAPTESSAEQSSETQGEATEQAPTIPVITPPVTPEHAAPALIVQLLADAPAAPAPSPQPTATPQTAEPCVAAPAESATPAQLPTDMANAGQQPATPPIVAGDDMASHKAAPVQANAEQQTQATPTAQPAAAQPQANPAVETQIAVATNASADDAPIDPALALLGAPVVAPMQARQTTSSDTERADAKAVAPESGKDIAPPQAVPAAAQAAPQKSAGQKSTAPSDAGNSKPTVIGAAPTITNMSDAGAPAQQALPATQSSAQHAPVQEAAAAAGRSAPVAAQISREIVRRFDGGSTQFELRLDPPELGRVDVRLEVTRDHRVTAVIAADSPQALTDLMRHARDLEQSLQSAGLDLTENGLTFDLRQGDQGSADAERNGARNGDSADSDTTQTESALPQTARLERWRGVRVDVMA